MRLRAKLRRDLSEGYSADHVDFRSRWPSHETGARRPVTEVTRIPVETGLAGSPLASSPNMSLGRRGKPRLYGKEDTLQRLSIAIIWRFPKHRFFILALKNQQIT